VIDVRNKSADEIHEIVKRDYQRAFDLANGPLLRAHVYEESDQSRIFLLVAHHLVVDGTALFVLVEELLAIYEALASEREPPRRTESASFSEFVEWQEAALKSADDSRTYWRSILTPAPEPLNVPTDKPRSGIREMHGASHWQQIDVDTADGLRQLARDRGVTNFVVYMSLWFTLLYRITGTPDVIVGTPVLGRPAARFARTVGDLVNMLPIRVRKLGELKFTELMELLRDTILGAMDRQDFPLPLMVEQKQGDEDYGQPPFQTAFALQEITRSSPLQQLLLTPDDQRTNYNGLDVSPYRLDQQEGQFELSLDIWPNETGLLCCWRFDSDLLQSPTIEAWSVCLQALAESVLINPDHALSDLSLLSATARNQLLDEFNSTIEPMPEAATLLDAFRERAGESPQSIAVQSAETNLSYRELDDRSNQLASYLLGKGVQQGELVGVCLDRTADLLVSLVAVLKTGCAYLPLDPSFPQARLEYMLEDSEAQWVLAHSAYRDLFSATDTTILCIDREGDAIKSCSRQPQPTTAVDGT